MEIYFCKYQDSDDQFIVSFYFLQNSLFWQKKRTNNCGRKYFAKHLNKFGSLAEFECFQVGLKYEVGLNVEFTDIIHI